MNILITGADGMLGTNLVRLLLKQGCSLTAFLHHSSKSTTLDNIKIKKVYGDLLDPESLDKAMVNIDTVIHTAASTSIWPARSEFVKKVNINGTQNVIDAVLKHKINKLVYVGSASSVNTNETVKSKYTFPGEKFGLDYIDSKYRAFRMVMNATKEKNLPATVILPTFMIGPYDSLPGSGKIITNFVNGKLKFFTKGGRNFIHVNDVATAIANSIELKYNGRYFIAGNKNISYTTFFNMLANIADKKELKTKIPSWIVLFVGILGSAYGKIFMRQPLVTYQMARISFENQFVYCQNSMDELQVTLTPVETAINDCYNWFIKNNYC
ncbi:MAG: NAD-dependent epimerase/dehydratase family protein [Bacteroidetes bacterium]|nr:NAD-dependent epimerase/dehydratase family protein [Bacteroidota bacterium]